MKTRDDKWIKTRTKSESDMREAILSWESKAIDLHFQDTFKSNGLYLTHCWYSVEVD